MLSTLRYAFRSIRGAPLASAIVVLCIGLSVGATTTVFAWTDRLARRPLPGVGGLERLVSVVSRLQGSEQSASYPAYLDWRDGTQTLEGLAAFSARQFGLRESADAGTPAEPVWGFLATDNYFAVLGVTPAAGRLFVAGESTVTGEAPVAVISHRLWRQRFGADSAAIGRRIYLNGVPLTIVGVASPEFGGTYAGLAFDVWIPITMHPALTGETGTLDQRGLRWVQTVGRLRDTAPLAEARAELGAIGGRMASAHMAEAGREAYLKPLDIGPAQRLSVLLSVLLGLTGLVTFIVCSNVANLLMLRGSARRFEIGVCLALGCGRGRIIGQLLCESMLLAGAGALVGLAVARLGQEILPALMPPTPLPLALRAGLDSRLLGVAIAVAAAMVPLFGVLPAVHAFRGAVVPSLRLARGGAGRGAARLRSGLVVAQLALSLTALVCAGQFLRSLAQISTLDRGFDRPENVLIVSTEFEQAGYRVPGQRAVAVDRLLSRIRALPGVTAATVATFVPLGFSGYRSVTVTVPGYVPANNESMTILANRIADGYFETLGIPVLQGRAIDARDTLDSTFAVVVNEAFARRFLSGRDPIGSTLAMGGGDATVVGVAANGKYRFDALEEASPPFVYIPYARESAASITIHVRSARPSTLLPALRGAFADVSPDLPMTGVTTLEEYTSLPLFPVRLASTILSSLGLVALVLAATGLYGVMAYRVAQRWRELAIRTALGASRSALFRLVFGDGVRQAIAGILVGLVLSAAASRVIAARLPRLGPPDAAVFAAAVGVLAAIALFAALMPALRASRVDPASVLRGE